LGSAGLLGSESKGLLESEKSEGFKESEEPSGSEELEGLSGFEELGGLSGSEEPEEADNLDRLGGLLNLMSITIATMITATLIHCEVEKNKKPPRERSPRNISVNIRITP